MISHNSIGFRFFPKRIYTILLSKLAKKIEFGILGYLFRRIDEMANRGLYVFGASGAVCIGTIAWVMLDQRAREESRQKTVRARLKNMEQQQKDNMAQFEKQKQQYEEQVGIGKQ
ncbi:hypothetical protein Ddc_05108 [Ditylenchus destructor]|nr:hypothetical protein Ddc_05108 [Ditylenchus destructor]